MTHKEPTYEDSLFKQVRLEKRQYVKEYFEDEYAALDIEMRSYMDEQLQYMKYRFTAAMWVELDRHVQVDLPALNLRWPKTWWDAFKERWFPGWLVKRFPVEWISLDRPAIKIDEPLFKSCYVNLKRGDQSSIYMVVPPSERDSPYLRLNRDKP